MREVFTAVLELLVEGGYVKLENYFVDGTEMEANANLHKVVWAKKTEKYKERLRQQIMDLWDETEKVNKVEEETCGEEDLEELGGKGGIDAEKLQRKVDELNERLKQQPEDKKLKKAVKTLEKKHMPRLEKYEAQEKTLAGRNSYSKTDPDATCFQMKEDRAAENLYPVQPTMCRLGPKDNSSWATASISGQAIRAVSSRIWNSNSYLKV